jgi:hypothetical protein
LEDGDDDEEGKEDVEQLHALGCVLDVAVPDAQQHLLCILRVAR